MPEKKSGEELLPITHYRANRERRAYLTRAATAATAIGPLSKSVGFTIITNGAFSMIDAIRHVLNQTGPAHVLVTTWVPGMQEVVDLTDLRDSRHVLSLRFIVDRGFFSTREAKAEELVRLVGLSDVRISSSHAKIATIRNDRWDFCLRGSLNLNANNRSENLDGDNDAGLCDAVGALYDALPALETPDGARAGFTAAMAPKPWEKKLAARMKRADRWR